MIPILEEWSIIENAMELAPYWFSVHEIIPETPVLSVVINAQYLY